MQNSSMPAANRRPSGNKWLVLITVVFGFFMILLDTTVINVAFQALRQEFGGSINESQWIISVYVMAMGIIMPLAGFLADRFGSKLVYLAGLGLFAVGSLLCGLSTSLYMLVAFRVIQGIGGGIAMPLGVSLLLQAFPKEEQGTALGYYGIAALVAPALGPILGGWLVNLNLWRVIFFINPPIGLIGVLLGLRFLMEHKGERHYPLDVPGIITEVIGFGAVLYAASIAADSGWTSAPTLIWFGIGAAGLVAFALVELFVAKEPLLDLRLYSNRIFLNASLLSYVSVIALFGAEFLLPIYLQELRGRSPLETGFILLPLAVTSGILVIMSGRIYDKIGPRPLMVSGFAILVINTWQLTQLRADTSIGWIIFLLSIRGIALGLTVQTTMVTALSVVPPRYLHRGSSLSSATRQVVQSLGVALLATVLASALSPAVQNLQTQMENAGPASASLIQTVGFCEVKATASSSGSNSTADPVAAASPAGAGQTSPSTALLQQACAENVAGFERSYQVTFYASLVALLLGFFLPGWPQKWVGRKGSNTPIVGD
ncbi:MAG: DHA2 family efflux MFS transporter permease subunit [Anaerolineaceae bacterium]|nr:DHA2 family efflux MFS transporter permease subunit [Anaerolineaceae bacterium]